MNESGRISTQVMSRGRVYALFALVTIGAALGNLSQTGMSAMLPAIMSDFGIDVDVGQWFTTGYMLVLGVAVPVATFLMRRLDNRNYLLLGFGFSYRKCTQELYAAIEQGAYGDGWRELFASSPLAGVSAEQTVFVCEGCGHWDVLEDPSIFEPYDPEKALEESEGRAADPDWK